MEAEALAGVLTLVFWLVGLAVTLAIVIGLFRAAKKRQEHFGQAPWGLSPAVWAIIGFFTLLLGVILFVVAKGQQGELTKSAV